MDRMLYVSMSGAKQIMQAQAVNAHNLANVSTTGFREDLAAFSSQNVNGTGYQSRVNALAQSTGVSHAQGPMITTGRNLDAAINGQGWMVVQAPDGSERLTRAGNLTVTSAGMLVSGNGYPVIGNTGGPIAVPPAEMIELGGDGTVSILPVGQEATTLVTVDRIKLANPDPASLVKDSDGLMRLMVVGDVTNEDANVKLQSGMLESSNVNAINAMVNMLSLSRQFEADVKLMGVAEELDTAASHLMRMS